MENLSTGEPYGFWRTRSVQNGFFLFFLGDHCTGSCTVIYVSIVLNMCRSAGRASNRSTDRQIRVMPEQIADQQIAVPRSSSSQNCYFPKTLIEMWIICLDPVSANSEKGRGLARSEEKFLKGIVGDKTMLRF